MTKKKKQPVPMLIVPKNATLKQIYAIARKEFTAADLQEYTDLKKFKFLDTQALLKRLEANQARMSKKRSTSR